MAKGQPERPFFFTFPVPVLLHERRGQQESKKEKKKKRNRAAYRLLPLPVLPLSLL